MLYLQGSFTEVAEVCYLSLWAEGIVTNDIIFVPIVDSRQINYLNNASTGKISPQCVSKNFVN